MTSVTDKTGQPVWQFGYDATGNRLTSQAGTGPLSNYTYALDSHHLLAVGPPGSEVLRGYDAMGNTTSIGSGAGAKGFDFDDSGRMDQLLDGAGNVKMQYVVNALGQRVEKAQPGSPANTQYTIRDEAGQVLGEYDSQRAPIRELVWMDGMPVGVLSGAGGSLAYLEPDQLGTPRVAIDAGSDAVVWNWPALNDPFGQGQPSGSLGLDLRFPGQVYDGESGVSYNYFRDYDSATGRYIESDPLGLFAGVSTYSYVFSNPLFWGDMNGLDPGDNFNSQWEAMWDAARYARSHKNQLIEYGGWIYKKGAKCYSYTELTSGKTSSLDYDQLVANRPANSTAGWHTHYIRAGNNTNPNDTDNQLSPGDRNFASDQHVPEFLVTPMGPIVGYNPANSWINPNTGGNMGPYQPPKR